MQDNDTSLGSADVRDYFKRTAVTFDDLYGDDQQAKTLFNQIFRKAIYWRFDLTFEALKDGDGKRYLDIGCGSGRHATLLAERGAHVTGVDFSDEMLELARQYAKSRDVSARTDFQLGQFFEWAKRKRKKYDAAYALGVLDYIDDSVGFLSEMSRLSDQVIVAWPTPSFPRSQLRTWRYKRQGCPVYFYNKKNIEDIHASAGLKIERIHPLGDASIWTSATKAA